jgi:hypothetical protein
MSTEIITCPNCGVQNRITNNDKSISYKKIPICAMCKTNLLLHQNITNTDSTKDVPDLNDSTIQKPTLIEEFCEAIEAEIKAEKKKSSSNAVPLTNGKRIYQSAGQHQYVFLIDSILNMPEGSPAELIAPGCSSMEAIIISVEELRIKLSVVNDLGDFVPHAKLQTDLSILLKKLMNRIEQKASEDNYVGLRMLGLADVS